MKILVTAFDPFGGESVNPALEAVKQLPTTIEGALIVWAEIPTVFHKSADVLRHKMRQENPDVVLCIGQAGGRTGLTPERVAINQDDARIPDNEGQQPIDMPIKEDGAAAYFSTLPIKAMVDAIHAVDLPASVSNSAGTFVCNHLMYQVLYLVDKEFPHVQAGFMHIPFMMSQVVNRPNMPAMSLTDITRGIEASISAIVRYAGKEDLRTIGGTTH